MSLYTVWSVTHPLDTGDMSCCCCRRFNNAGRNGRRHRAILAPFHPPARLAPIMLPQHLSAQATHGQHGMYPTNSAPSQQG